MKKILILVFSNLKIDARVRRQINWASQNNQVTVVCFDSDEIPNVEIIKIEQTRLTPLRKMLMGFALLLKNYTVAYNLFHNYSYLIKQLKGNNYDLIIANDIDTLPLAFKIKGPSKIIFDAHEYAPRHFENNKTWKLFFQPFYISLCEKYISKVDAMFTVGKGLALEYEKNFNTKPIIITNATRYHDIKPSETIPGKIRMIHHGIANTSRRLEMMIEMMDYLDDRFTLDMILMTSNYASDKTQAYIEALKNRISTSSKIKILPGVKSDDIVRTINTYDIGVFLIPPINFNYANTLPNKLFDYIQARLGIAIGPTPEMAEIVNQYKAGVVADDFSAKSLAHKLNQLKTEDILSFKRNAGLAAKALNAERNQIIFQNTITQLFTKQ